MIQIKFNTFGPGVKDIQFGLEKLTTIKRGYIQIPFYIVSKQQKYSIRDPVINGIDKQDEYKGRPPRGTPEDTT